jgi:FkbM family methyltransferase|tara:strand:+ start:192 stop:818 length:627 start_codon:yes stop_codon:yes gene_type:complete
MQIEKINNFWVPSNDIHLSDWKAGQPFTQNKCLNKFIEWCDQHGKKFKTVLDIGAWCGTWTQVMEPYANKIIAFEPDKLHFDCLNKNCKNSINKQVAVGNTFKKIKLIGDNFTQAKRVGEEGDIQMITIDSLNLHNVDMIKIDVEGYEMEVLKGSDKTLRTVEYVMIELNSNTGKYGSSNKECVDFLEQLGFKLLLEHWPDKVFYRAD